MQQMGWFWSKVVEVNCFNSTSDEVDVQVVGNTDIGDEL